MRDDEGGTPRVNARRGRVWDLPVRVVHWLLAACVAIAWLTRDARLVDLHAAAGYCALLLVAFRIAWGFAGTAHARFASFLYSPRAALAYVRSALRGGAPHFTGHNPAGSWAAYFLLAGVAAAGLTGIVAIAGMFGMGPMPLALPPAAADWMRKAHEWIAWALLGLIALHIAGAIWGSRVHRENLVAAMVSGRKTLHGEAAPPVAARASIAVSLLIVLGIFTALYLQIAGWTNAYAAQRSVAPRADAVAPRWQKECGSCHLAYAPDLLPLRSWQRMLREQDAHFGEDLSLDANSVRELLAIAQRARPGSWAAWKLAASAPAAAAPQRISDLRYWRHAHEDLDTSAFKAPVSAGRHDCEACHRDAASGIFHPRMIQKPEHRSFR